MSGFYVCKCCTRFWICLNMDEKCPMAGFWICLVNVSKSLNRPWVLNMPGLRIWQGHEYARVTQDAKFELALIMSQYVWVYTLLTLNMIAYAGIYQKKQSAEYARILNVSDAVHSIRSQRCIQNTVKHLRWSV